MRAPSATIRRPASMPGERRKKLSRVVRNISSRVRGCSKAERCKPCASQTSTPCRPKVERSVKQLGDRQCVSQAWRIHGNERFTTGHFAEAQEAYLEGVRIAREVGDRAELANLLNGLSVVAESNMEWEQAEQTLIEAIALKKETGFNPGEVQIQLAQLYMRLGRWTDAANMADAAFMEAQKTQAREELGEVLLVARGASAFAWPPGCRSEPRRERDLPS